MLSQFKKVVALLNKGNGSTTVDLIVKVSI